MDSTEPLNMGWIFRICYSWYGFTFMAKGICTDREYEYIIHVNFNLHEMCNILTKPGFNPRRIGDRLVWVVRSSDLTHWAIRVPRRNRSSIGSVHGTLAVIEGCFTNRRNLPVHTLVNVLRLNSYKPITNTAWVEARLCKLAKKSALDSQLHVIKFTSCLPMVGGSLRVLRLPPPLLFLFSL
jgi:hypothetical protein